MKIQRIVMALLLVGLAQGEGTLAGDTRWSAYGGGPGAEQYQSARDITASNVAELEVAWVYRTGELSDGSDGSPDTRLEVTPIQFEDTLLFCTARNDVVALDAASGQERWRYRSDPDNATAFYGGQYCRGIALWQSPEDEGVCSARVLQAGLDGTLHAMDARSGEPCADFGNSGQLALNDFDYHGEGRVFNTSPPAVVGDVLVVGASFYDNSVGNAPDGIVRAFDVRSGALRWSWNPIPEQLSDSVGGANAWAPLAVDEQRGWVFIPTGSPSYDVLGSARKQAIPHANAVVAIDAASGELQWAFQTVRHDLWDYDLASQPTLSRITWRGEPRDVLIQGTKQGFIFVLDRDTGEPVFPVDNRSVPASDVPGELAASTQPWPRVPEPLASQVIGGEDAWGALYFDRLACQRMLEPLRNEGLFTPPSLQGSLLHPSFLGGINWGGIAVDPERQVGIVNVSNLVASVRLIPRETFNPQQHQPEGFSYYEMRGAPYVLVRGVLRSPLGAPCNPPPWGTLNAIDLSSGETLWRIPFGRTELAAGLRSPASWGAPNIGGPLLTGSGLIFIGASPDPYLRAYDIDSGRLLWEGELPVPAFSSPMSYRAADGRQYVVIAAGGSLGFETPLDNAIVAFALPRSTESESEE